MVFSDRSERREPLLHFASWVQGRSGFTTIVRLLEGDGLKMIKLKNEAEAEIQADIKKMGMEAFHLAVVTAQFDLGLETLVQSFGIGSVRANTVLLNWFPRLTQGGARVREAQFGSRLRTAARYGMNIIMLDVKPENWAELQATPSDRRRIDVWWWGDPSSRLMLLLAYLLTRTESWGEAKIRVLDVCAAGDREKTVADLSHMLEDVRIQAEPEVVAAVKPDAVAAYSADAALVFLPFRLRGNRPLDPFDAPLNQIVERLPLTALVLATEDIDLDAEPEEGTAGTVAAAMDALEDAGERARKAERNAAHAAEEAETAETKLAQLETKLEAAADGAIIAKMTDEARKAKQAAEKAARRAAKAKAKVEDAAQQVETLGVERPDKDKAADPDEGALTEPEPKRS
jgi:hypothetical protein